MEQVAFQIGDDGVCPLTGKPTHFYQHPNDTVIRWATEDVGTITATFFAKSRMDLLLDPQKEFLLEKFKVKMPEVVDGPHLIAYLGKDYLNRD